MDITLEMVDQVRERTCCSYEEAKAALEAANGDVVDAIIRIEQDEGTVIDLNEKIAELTEKVKAAVQMGNVNRIRVMRENRELVNIPVNVGIAGGVLGFLAGWPVVISAAVAGAVAKYGFNCRFEILKEDGSIDEIYNDESWDEKELTVPETDEAPREEAEKAPEQKKEEPAEKTEDAPKKTEDAPEKNK